MHPNPAFQCTADASANLLVDEVGFGMVFLSTVNGPRVAHAALVRTGPDEIRFHLARTNALSGELDGATALIVVNGPRGYVSPRWYANGDQVPTWNYIAVELEGTVRKLDNGALDDLLDRLANANEHALPGTPWTMATMQPERLATMKRAIAGFSLTIDARRTTVKLSQNKSEEDRLGVIAGLDGRGDTALAAYMRDSAG